MIVTVAQVQDAHQCAGGWLVPPDGDGDAHAEPTPCAVCRPWLMERRPPTHAELVDAAERAGRPAPRAPRR